MNEMIWNPTAETIRCYCGHTADDHDERPITGGYAPCHALDCKCLDYWGDLHGRY